MISRFKNISAIRRRLYQTESGHFVSDVKYEKSCRFNFISKSGIGDRFDGILDALTAGSKISGSKDRIHDTEQFLFLSFEVDFSAGSTADVGLRYEQSCKAEDFHAIFRCQTGNICIPKWCALDRQQKIDWQSLGWISRSSRSVSTTSSLLSPIPMIPPLQISNPSP